jgi:hypothetical protein
MTTEPLTQPEPTEGRAYRKFFIRGEKRLSAEQSKLYSTTIPIRGRQTDDVRLNNLYRDCFAIHVTDYFGASADSLTLSSQEDRLIAADNITARFLTKHYTPPLIEPTRETASPNEKKTPGLDLDTFIKRIATNPIDNCTVDSDELGTNKVTYLIGDVGMGKSTLIARIHMQCAPGAREPDGYRTVPIVYDFETRHRDGERLKPIGDEFWADLYTHIYQVLSSRTDIKRQAELDAVAINPRITDTTFHPFLIHHLRQLVHHLALHKIRLLIIFDNLDRYHFRYTEYAFFPKYAEGQMSSVRDNVSALVKTFDRGDLWKCGICTLFVCRKYLYEYLVKFGDVVPKDNHFGLFEIAPSTVTEVVASRFGIYQEAIGVISPQQAKAKQAALGDFMGHMAGVMAVKKVGEKLKHSSPALDALARIGHNGHRSLVRFLSSLSLRYTDVDAFNRLLVDQPHLLLLLYISNNQKRFTQQQEHFPNLFLNDCLLGRNDDFLEAHRPHKHSYWLKYLMLRFVLHQENIGEFPTPQDVIEEFACAGGYPLHFVRYMLGSLCTTTEYSCLRIDYSDGSAISDCRLALTERGRYLIAYDRRLFHEQSSVEFCFNFHYLQLAIDDRVLALPRSKADSIFVEADYSYLYLPDSEYKPAAPRIVLRKLEATFHFLQVLENFYALEKAWYPSVFAHLAGLGVTVSFHAIREHLLETTKVLLRTMTRTGDYAHFEQLEAVLRHDTSLEEAVRILPSEALEVHR